MAKPSEISAPTSDDLNKMLLAAMTAATQAPMEESHEKDSMPSDSFLQEIMPDVLQENQLNETLPTVEAVDLVVDGALLREFEH
ncbi:hypothetical protein BCR33DRAFT_792940 [Rhizoclosmatium globosum]|uniref:Uncharacterized protein n=1 Tax=Rhizoclosmatium globosum TaxID=329046 RepID=A0A1Y2B4F7_9FUNG|nr:hypothetical protein BCR33DRAFT_792940 [Rhizoclosmatium globosum]|eukprot:ORY29614.1 hypothetical protein BCR33DRAFT_792940 [Rhizoclosmatium globosum]